MKNLFNYDPLDEAESLTGKSYKDDKETMGLGFLLMQASKHVKELKLKETNDTTLTNEISNYIKIIEDFGFNKVYEEIFVIENREEKQYMYWVDGILLVFDTHYGYINGSSFYYNWVPNKDTEYYKYISSGGFAKDNKTWLGNHDGREAIKYKINQLKCNGKILKVWNEQMFLWLCHYGDTKNEEYDHKGIILDKIKRLPKEIQQAIKG